MAEQVITKEEKKKVAEEAKDAKKEKKIHSRGSGS